MAGKKTAMLMLGVLLVVGMIFVGSASADDAVNSSITTWNELNENITNWNSIGGNGMLTIVLDNTIESDAAGPNDEGITVSRNITITSSSGKNARIDVVQKGRIFTIDSTGNLTLRGNESSTLSLTGGMLNDYSHFGGAVSMDGGRLTILPGAEITNCSSLLRGGAVYADKHAEVILAGGNITGCRNLLGSSGGAAVYVNESSFTISSGIIANCSSLYNGGAVYASDSTVLMDNGTIMNCSASEYGGGLFIYDSRFTLNKGIIVDCSGNDGGGVFVYAGMFIMNDGNITSCNADNMGGAVYVDGDSEFSMNGGMISDSTAGSGGGVLSYGGFTMDGGTMDNCSAANEGGAVYLISSYPNPGMFTLKNGTIMNCSASYRGGGVYMNGGAIFTLQEGTITGCTAEEQGGAVYVYDTSSFDMNGGTIANCTATYEGGGVYVSFEGQFNVSFDATVTGNNVANNVFLEGDSCLNLVGPFTGNISITNPEGASGTKFGTFVSGREEDAKNFLSDTPGYFGIVNGTNLEWTPINITVPVTDGKAVFGGTNTTVLNNAVTSLVASVVLEDVSNVVGTVTFKANASAGDPVPTTSGYTKKGDVSIFDITATPLTGCTAYINVSVIFQEGQRKDRDIVRFWHYKNGNWDALSGTPIADMPNKVTYSVPTDAFSPFAISLETKKTSPYVPSHSKQTGSTVILQESEIAPTATPTAEPTGNPTLNPTVKPTQPTQKSPAPFVGLVLGLGAALVLARMRR